MTLNTKIARQEKKYCRIRFRYSHETVENMPLESFSCGA